MEDLNIPQNVIGKIFYLNKPDKANESKNNLVDNLVNKEKLNVFKFLLQLNFYYKKLNRLYKEPLENNFNLEKGFIINKDLIENYKSYFNFNKIINDCKKEEIKLLFNKYKKQQNDLKEKNSDNFFTEIFNILKKEYINKLKNEDNDNFNKLNNCEICNYKLKVYNNHNFCYFENCVIVDEKLFFLLFNNEQIKKKIEIYYLIGDQKLILLFDTFINIGTLNNDFVFLPDMLINFKNENYKKILNKLKSKGYEEFIKTFNEEFNQGHNYAFLLSKENNNLNLNDKLPKRENVENDLCNKNIQIKKEHNQNKNSNSSYIKPKIIFSFNQNQNNNKNKIKDTLYNQYNYDKFLEDNKLNPVKNKSNNEIKLNNELKNIILILIDSEKMKKKMSYPLNKYNYQFNLYYLLNYDWLEKYLEFTKMKDFYEFLVKNKIIENFIKNNSDSTIIDDELIIKEIISEVDPYLINQIKQMDNSYYSILKNKNNICMSYFIKKEDKLLYYYSNFIIITKDTKDLLYKEFFLNFEITNILFGENKIFIEVEKNGENILEIGHLDKNNIFIPNLFFDYYTNQILNHNKNLLINKGFDKYLDYYLLFKKDLYSPIFDEDNKIIGNAFKYNSSIKDFSSFIINKQLQTNIKLFFNTFELVEKLNKSKIIYESYSIVKNSYIQKYKEIYNYSNLEQELYKNNIVNKTIQTIKNNFTEKKKIVNNKKVILIIKNLTPQINYNYNGIQFIKVVKELMKEQLVPNLEVLNFKNKELFY